MNSHTPSRRDVAIWPLGAAGTLSALQMLNAKEARADDLDNLPLTGGQIDPSLLNAFRFDRKNAEHPGVAFLHHSGLLVGFGSNLFHCDISSNTCRLFVNRRQVFVSSVTADVAENIDLLAVGTSGTATQTARDSFGRAITSTIFVEAINDLPDDFLITGNTQSERFTGAFFKITFETSLPHGEVAQIKTTYNILTRSFPLGVNIVSRAQNSIIDPNAQLLLRIAAQKIMEKFGSLLAIPPTGLQQDFPWGALFNFIGAVVSCGLAAGSAIAAAACGYFFGKVVDEITGRVGDFDQTIEPGQMAL